MTNASKNDVVADQTSWIASRSVLGSKILVLARPHLHLSLIFHFVSDVQPHFGRTCDIRLRLEKGDHPPYDSNEILPSPSHAEAALTWIRYSGL